MISGVKRTKLIRLSRRPDGSTVHSEKNLNLVDAFTEIANIGAYDKERDDINQHARALGQPGPSPFKTYEEWKLILGRALSTMGCKRSWSALLNMFKGIGPALRRFFLPAFYIAAYRKEWPERYRAWDPAWEQIHSEFEEDGTLLLDEDDDDEDEDQDQGSTAGGGGGGGERSSARLRFNESMSHISFEDLNPKRTMQRNEHEGCARLVFNVSGTIFETQWRTILKCPQSKLGNPSRLAAYFDPERDEFYFDRSPAVFEAILYYMQSGGHRLERPPSIPLHVFEEELNFYGLGSAVIEQFLADEGVIEDEVEQVPKPLLQRKLWLLFEFPESSKQARLLSYVSLFAVILNLASFIIETLEIYHERAIESLSLGDSFFLVETITMIWFVFEILVRVIVCPSFYEYIGGIMNIIDICAVVPYFINFIPNPPSVFIGYLGFNPPPGSPYFTVFKITRLVKVFRIFKLSRHSVGLRILAQTLKSSTSELVLLGIFLGMGVLIFSSAMYYAEIDHPGSVFKSIPSAWVWAVNTMTTLGDAEDLPKTFWGKVVGSACAVAGVLTLALPVPVIVSNFNYYYYRSKETGRIRKVGVPYMVQSCNFLPFCRNKKGYDPSTDDSLSRAQKTMYMSEETRVKIFLNKYTRKIKRYKKLKLNAEKEAAEAKAAADEARREGILHIVGESMDGALLGDTISVIRDSTSGSGTNVRRVGVDGDGDGGGHGHGGGGGVDTVSVSRG